MKAKVKSVYHSIDVEAYDPKDAFQKAIEEIKNSKALYQGGTFRDKAESIKRIKAGKAPKVQFEKIEATAEKRFIVEYNDGCVGNITSLVEAKSIALKKAIEKKNAVQIKLAPFQTLIYKVKADTGTMGKYNVYLVEDGVPLK